MNADSRPEAAVGDAVNVSQKSNRTYPHAALMTDMAWHIAWLDGGHRHWWLRELEWCERGRVA
jgi:hypothetical protein